MKLMIKSEDIVDGKVNITEIKGKYAIVKVSGKISVDWEKSLTAMNIMAEHGWKCIQLIAGGSFAGFLVERA